MTEITTIQITKEQREAFEAVKAHENEPHRVAFQRLLDAYDGSASADSAAPMPEDLTVELEASERRTIAEEVAEALR